MALIKKRGWYHHVFREGGKARWVALRTQYKEEAQIRMGERLRQQHRPMFGVAVDPQDIPWAELVKKFLDHKKGNGDCPRTLERAVAFFKNVDLVLGIHMTSEWRPELLERFKQKRLENGAAPGTVNKELEAIRSALRRARRWGYIAPSQEDLEEIRKVKDPRRPAFCFSEAEAERLLAAAKPFWKVAILLGLRAGLRRSEALHLLWSDVDFERMELKVVDRPGAHTKTRKSRTIPLDPGLAEWLWQWKALHSGASRVLPWTDESYGGKSSFSRGFKRLLRRLGFPKEARFHSLRHTFATNLARANVNQLKISYILGHSSVVQTATYTHMDMGDARQAIAQLSPLANPSNIGLTDSPTLGNIETLSATRTNRTGEGDHEQV